jgi:hypothetical protein
VVPLCYGHQNLKLGQNRVQISEGINALLMIDRSLTTV